MYFYIFDIEQLQKNKKNNLAKSYQVEVQGEGWGHAEEIIYFCWLGNALVFPQKSWWRWADRGKSGIRLLSSQPTPG